jgi:hypothetical protein
MRTGARPVVLMAVAAVAGLALVAGLAARDGGSTPLTDKAGTPAPVAGGAPSSTTVASLPTTVSSRLTAEAVGSVTYTSGDDDGPGLVVTNSGSAIADVGGNVVSGVGAGPPGTIITGDVTAVGNVSSVRTP